MTAPERQKPGEFKLDETPEQRERRLAKNRAANARWRAKNPGIRRDYMLVYGYKWRAANRDKLRERQPEYDRRRRAKLTDADRQAINARRAAYEAENVELAKAWRAAARKRYAASAKGKLNRLLVGQRRRAAGELSVRQLVEMFGYFRGACAYCGVKPERLTVDHLVAVSVGGLSVQKNLVAACWSCNRRKSDAPWAMWFKAQAFFSVARVRRILAWTGSP